MDGFVKTAAFILAGLFILCMAIGLALVVKLKDAGAINPEKIRDYVLTEEERTWLAKMRSKPEEPAAETHKAAPAEGGATEEELLTRIAEKANASRATKVIEELRLQKLALDERQAWLDQQNAELALARNDLQRLRRQLDSKDQEIKDTVKKLDEERAVWAAAQAQNTKGIEAMGETEKARYAAQAKLYEQMKDAAWLSLKRFEPKEIARYLVLMETKRAAKMLSLAEADKTLPEDFVTNIHKALLNIDPNGKSADQTARLATLYAFMKGDEVVKYLRASSVDETVGILDAMKGNDKKRVEILEALRKADPDKALEVQKALTKLAPTGTP